MSLYELQIIATAADMVTIQKELEAAKPGGTLFGLNRSEHPYRLAEQQYVGPRRPALPDARQQEKAVPGVRYRVYDNIMADEVLVVAQAPNGSGRMMRIDGRVWHMMKSRTNPPPGEIAITDDDIETAFCVAAAYSVHPFAPPGSDHEPTRATALEAELFYTDPEVVAHVKKQLDMGPGVLTTENERFDIGLAVAYVRACELKEPERTWLERATARMRALENRKNAR